MVCLLKLGNKEYLLVNYLLIRYLYISCNGITCFLEACSLLALHSPSGPHPLVKTAPCQPVADASSGLRCPLPPLVSFSLRPPWPSVSLLCGASVSHSWRQQYRCPHVLPYATGGVCVLLSHHGCGCVQSYHLWPVFLQSPCCGCGARDDVRLQFHHFLCLRWKFFHVSGDGVYVGAVIEEAP